MRARPGRRSVEERQQAVPELFAGKATIDHIARRLGVHASTVEGWRADALAGVEQALRRGSGKAAAELELEHKQRDLEQVVTKPSIQKCLLEHTFAPVGRPTGNAVVERFIRTLKEELIWLQEWDCAADLAVAVAAWLKHYNTRRPHQALGWQTPNERRADRLAAPLQLAA